MRILSLDELDMLNHTFSYHEPSEDQQFRYNKLRGDARIFAETILRCTPKSADQSAAIRLLRECVMTANAAIALE